MNNTKQVLDTIYYVGGNDRRITRFENLFPIYHGMAYNSYLIIDDKTVLMDTVDGSISDLFMSNVEYVLAGRKLDYLVINHMEPDHCANIANIIRRYPQVKLIGNTKTFQLFEQFYTLDAKANYVIVKDQDELVIGKTTLRFYFAAMVHWPEVMMTYDIKHEVLFSADAFGVFGANQGTIFADEYDFKGLSMDEARRYYANIVGKFGGPVQSIFKKLSNESIQMICPLHGPIFRGTILAEILGKYNLWSTYQAEEKSVLFIYGSMYNNTADLVDALAFKLSDMGVKNMRIYDVAAHDPSYLIAEIWKYSHIVLAIPTYNGDLYYKMHGLLHEMQSLNLQDRKIGLIINGSWGGRTLENSISMIEKMKNTPIIGNPLVIKSSYQLSNQAELNDLALALFKSLKES